MEPKFVLAALFALVAIMVFYFSSRRKSASDIEFVYVNQDGSIREVSPNERDYLSKQFSGGDSGRPYIKSDYKSLDGWGSQSGFMGRSKVPAGLPILPVHPNYDALEKKLGYDTLGSNRAAGDTIETNADGSITCTPNPHISPQKRFELSRQYVLAEQRRREALAKVEKPEFPE